MTSSLWIYRSCSVAAAALILAAAPAAPADISLEPGRFKRGFARVEGVLGGEKMTTTVADFDGDGRKELLKLEQQPAGQVASQLIGIEITPGFPAVWHRASPHKERLSRGWLEDLDGDGAIDFAVNTTSEDSHWLEVRSFDGRVLLRFVPEPPLDGSFDGTIEAGPVYDINADGSADVIVSIDAGFRADRREVVAVSGADGSILWSTPVACMSLGNMVILPECEEGPRLLIGGWGAGNGARSGRLSDSEAWKIVLDLDGTILEADSLGGTHASVVFASTVGGRRAVNPPYVTIGGTGLTDWADFGIYRLDTCGRFDCSIPMPGMIGELWLAHLSSDSEFELLYRMGDEPVLDVLSDRLEPRKTYRLDRPVPRTWVADLWGDARDEIVLGSASGEIFILDPEFRPLAYLDTEMEIPAGVWLVERGETDAQFLVADGRRAILVRAGLLPRRLPLAAAAAGGGAVLLAGAGFLLARRHRARKRRALLVTELAVALRALTVFGHGEPGRVMARTAMLLGSASPERLGQERWKSAVAEALAGFRREVPTACEAVWESLAVLPATVLAWKPVQKSSIEIVEEFETLANDVSQGIYPDPDSLVGAAERLRDIDRRLLDLRRMIRARFRCRVPDVVREVVARLQEGPASTGVSMAVSLRSPSERLYARVETNRLRREVVEELLANAILAQADAEAGWIEIRLMRDGDLVVIEVEDGGPGVRPDLAARVFQRGVSTKSEGGGFGLYQARRALEEFGGGLTYQQAPSGGALFRVTIPAAEPPYEGRRSAAGPGSASPEPRSAGSWSSGSGEGDV